MGRYEQVLLPLGITLLSNRGSGIKKERVVLLPLGITLLSNSRTTNSHTPRVLLPLGITLPGHTASANVFQFYYHLVLHYSQTKTAGISFGKMGKLAVFLRFGAALRHYNRVSGGSKTIITHESKFAKVFVDDPHLLTGSDRLFLSALQQENGQFFIKHRLIKKRYFILRKE